jgi:site-specific recombinase XerD
MEILGQANIATTMEIYTHVSSDVQREALEKISKLGS